MAMLRITAVGDTPVCAEGSWQPIEALLAAQTRDLPSGAPVVFVTHGYRYSPWTPHNNPFDTLLSARPQRGQRKARALPRKLGLAPDQTRAGLCIALGWHGRGSLATAMDRAQAAGHALARVADQLAETRPDLRLSAVSHSLGASVLMAAMHKAEIARFQRLLLLAPAAHRADALVALGAPAAREAEVISVRSRENVFFECLFALARGSAPTVVAGMRDHPQWVELSLSDPVAAQNLALRGLRLGPQRRPVCHWSGFLRPGVWPLYRRMLFAPQTLPLATLRHLGTAPLSPGPIRSTFSPTQQERI